MLCLPHEILTSNKKTKTECPWGVLPQARSVVPMPPSISATASGVVFVQLGSFIAAAFPRSCCYGTSDIHIDDVLVHRVTHDIGEDTPENTTKEPTPVSVGLFNENPFATKDRPNNEFNTVTHTRIMALRPAKTTRRRSPDEGGVPTCLRLPCLSQVESAHYHPALQNFMSDPASAIALSSTVRSTLQVHSAAQRVEVSSQGQHTRLL